MVDINLTALQKSIAKAPPTQYEQQYLTGFRGLLVIETFLWVFLQTFAPTTVYVSGNEYGPNDQVMVRKVLSVLFWNQYFLIGAIIFLSARSLAIPFFRNPTKETIARALLTRSLSLCIPVAICLAIVKGSFTYDFINVTIERFKAGTNNHAMPVPYQLPTTLSYWNAVFELFWVSHQFQVQAGNYAFPTETLWLINAVYIQSYTVYMTMIIVPYTRPKWRAQFSIPFIIAAWWCQSWAWFSISGLIMCDMVMNMDFKARAQRGIPIQFRGRAWRQPDGRPRRLPVWLVAGIVMLGGIAMQYVWATARPDLFPNEWMVHSDPYSIGGLDTEYETNHTSARDDVYLMLVGFFFLLETYDVLQRAMQNPFFVYLGRRSLSYFLIQPILAYQVGIRVFNQLRVNNHLAYPGSVVVTLITCLAVTVPAAELFHRMVVVPSRYLAHHFHDFITS